VTVRNVKFSQKKVLRAVFGRFVESRRPKTVHTCRRPYSSIARDSIQKQYDYNENTRKNKDGWIVNMLERPRVSAYDEKEVLVMVVVLLFSFLKKCKTNQMRFE
jgi:hypothetical protein